MITPTMEQMAIAVLRGDEAAARALADEVVGVCAEGGVHLPPVHRLSVSADRIRAVVFIDASVPAPTEADIESLHASMQQWLRGEAGVAVMSPGISRIELYEMPEQGIPGVTSISGSLDVPFASTPWPDPLTCKRCGNAAASGTAWMHYSDSGNIILCDDCHQQAQKEAAAD